MPSTVLLRSAQETICDNYHCHHYDDYLNAFKYLLRILWKTNQRGVMWL